MKQKIHSKKPKIKKKNTSIAEINRILDLIKDISLDTKDNKNENNKKNLFQKNSLFNKNEITKKDKEKKINTDIIDNQKLNGINDRSYFINTIKDKNTFNIDEFNLKDVTGDGNCGYRAIALQLYSNEENYDIVRKTVYNYLIPRKNLYTNYNFEHFGAILNATDYIDHIQDDGFWMGELEIQSISEIYDVTLIVFQLVDDNTLKIINIYGNLNDNNKNLLTLCYINDNHFNVVYNKNNNIPNICLDKSDIKIRASKNIKNFKGNNILKLNYANNNRKIKYEDIYNYLNAKKYNLSNLYPDYINEISPLQKRKSAKRYFRRITKGFTIDEKYNRLKKKINISNDKCNPKIKEFFIPYDFEKIKIIKRLHEFSTHRGYKTLYNLIKDDHFWWNNIYNDVYNFVKNCPICQSTHNQKKKKPVIMQIITTKPRERYVLDLQDIKNHLQDDKNEYKFFFNIIDHYSKLTGSYLLKNKKANSIIIALNNFIAIYGSPKSIQTDNGAEFNNTLLTEYCRHNNIEIIHSSPRHPTTNGVVERIHQEISKSIYAEKLKNKGNFNLEFALSNAIRAQNNIVSRVTKYKPVDLFFNYEAYDNNKIF